MKTIASLAAAAAVGLTLAATAVAPAHAAGCIYGGVKHTGERVSLSAHGYAAKQKKACQRARNKCNRRLERAYRNGKMPRGVTCKRVASG